MLAISAIIEVKPEHVEDFKKLALRHAENCLKHEEGCLGFDVFTGWEAPARFYFHERYTDQAAIDAHRQTPYFAEYLRLSADWTVNKESAVWALVP